MACEICGTIKMVRHSLAQRFRACSRRCAGELGRRSWPRTSSLENAMMRAFANLDMVVSPQYAIDHYTVDFALPNEKIVIECDGIYWHSLPRQQARDQHKNAWLERGGWIV